jgi:serine/threonine-protein kinase
MAERIGKYEVIDQIGRGGMGTIYRARDPVLQRSVALKVISNLEVTPELRARFFREAQACARLTHPNIVIIHDMGEDSGRLFIVMELLDGEELRRVIERQAQMALRDKLDIVRQICDGLHYAHQKGVVHRDVKPANILLLRNGQVKILDFGIAQIAGAATQRDLTRTGVFMGTLRYMAPEQVRGQADRRSDVFSVAAVSYELFSGRPPFVGDDPLQILEALRTTTPPRLTELDPRLPAELADVLERALQKEPADRLADLGQMARQLERLQRELAEGGAGQEPMAQPTARPDPPQPAAATTPSAPAAAREEARRAPRVAIATGAVLAAIVVAALYWWLPATPRIHVAGTPPGIAQGTGAVSSGSGSSRSAKPEATGDPPSRPTAVDERAARSAPRERETGRVNSPARAERATTSAPAPAPAREESPATTGTDRKSPAPREPGPTVMVGPGSSSARDDAEHARSRMNVARQAAERVAAGFYARTRFASARSKERDGMARLAQSDYTAASRLFAEAQSEYQAAAAEAPGEEEKERQLARLRTGLDQAHAGVAASRREALAAQADQLAKELFDQAQARQVEGDGLAGRKELAAAARAYQEAAERYGQAAARARAARPGR